MIGTMGCSEILRLSNLKLGGELFDSIGHSLGVDVNDAQCRTLV